MTQIVDMLGHFPASREASTLWVSLRFLLQCLDMTLPLCDDGTLEAAAVWRKWCRILWNSTKCGNKGKYQISMEGK